MATESIFRRALSAFACLALPLCAAVAAAHGGVVEEDDVCVISINYLKGHFKVYQPRTDGHRQYCEDLPAATESVFVMEYLHDAMTTTPIDFRIIRDATGKGRFARWEDVAAIEDLDAVTVYYRPPVVEPDVYTVVHDFDAQGAYIGIVTARIGDAGEIVRAVFPFRVGFSGFGYWPVIVAVLLLVQLHYLATSGRLGRWWRRVRGMAPAATAALLVAMSLPVFAGGTAESQRGRYTVSWASSIEPVPINRIHSWEIRVVDADGRPVDGADIVVDGGMPAHDHGLPTRPRATPLPDDGRYRIDGLRFHMAGAWRLNLDITAANGNDTVVIDLAL